MKKLLKKKNYLITIKKNFKILLNIEAKTLFIKKSIIFIYFTMNS